MTPAKRRPATPASQGPKRAAAAPKMPTVPDVPTPPARRSVRAPDGPTAPPDAPVPDALVTPPVAPVGTNDGTQLLGPDGEPVTEEAAAGDARADSAPPKETGRVDPADRSTTQSQRGPLGLYPLPVWPD